MECARQALRAAKVLVIANALNARQGEPRAPSEPWPAFTPEEIVAVRDWVAAGGSLLLIVDRRPFAGAAADLALAFGVRLRNDWALDPRDRDNPLVFRRADGTLVDHAITRGIDEVATFQGSSFTLEEGGQPLLVFGPSVYSVTLINRPDANPLPLKGSLQGAAVSFGKGRIGVFGEAAMFSAQLTGPEKRPMGMNAPIARQNALLLLNLMRWLAGAV